MNTPTADESVLMAYILFERISIQPRTNVIGDHGEQCRYCGEDAATEQDIVHDDQCTHVGVMQWLNAVWHQRDDIRAAYKHEPEIPTHFRFD